MAGVKIKDAPLVEQVAGIDKIPVSDGSEQPKTVSVDQIKNYTLEGVASSEALSSAIANHDASENAHAPLMAKVQESIDAVKGDVYTKTQADEKFALLSKQPYRIDSPMSLLDLETQSGYPIEMITHCLGETLESFLNNGHYLNCYFPQYIARVQQKTYYDSSDVFHFRVLFTFVESDYIKDITIDQARGSETCDITVVKKQLVTNILAISESNYANLSSKDSSTLYLIY